MGSGLSLDGFTVMTVQPASRFPSKKENFLSSKTVRFGCAMHSPALCAVVGWVHWARRCGDRKTKNNSIRRCCRSVSKKVFSPRRLRRATGAPPRAGFRIHLRNKIKQQHLAMLLFGGGRWIRTTESTANRFTVCPLWPLGNSPIFGSLLKRLELVDGLEPPTC